MSVEWDFPEFASAGVDWEFEVARESDAESEDSTKDCFAEACLPAALEVCEAIALVLETEEWAVPIAAVAALILVAMGPVRFAAAQEVESSVVDLSASVAIVAELGLVEPAETTQFAFVVVGS